VTTKVSNTPRYALYVLCLLTALNFLNYVDRQVITSMYDDLRAHFHFSDTQIGAFSSGFFFMHAVTTVPFGWAADNYDRRHIMAGAVILWSLATLGSAYAWGFLSMLTFRSMVGVGEAAYGPVANTVLAEIFPADRKARVIAIFNGGMFAGACIGIYTGARLGFPKSFLYVGYPGIVMGLLAWNLRIKPRRDITVRAPYPGFIKVVKDAWASINVPTLRWMLVAGVLISFAVGGYIIWFIDFVTRYKHVEKHAAANIYGAIAISGGTIGVIVGGRVADWLQRRRPDGRILTIAIGFLAAVPFAIGAIYLPNGIPFYVSSWLMMFFIPWYNGPMAAVIDDVVDDERASTAQASFTFFLHFLGSGPAAVAVGTLSSFVGLQHALLLPTGCILISAFFCLRGAREVDADMRARNARAEAARARGDVFS
jgi:predicted MFS family arabinose efflux permease